MQAAATWPILMKKITGEKDEVDFGITSDLEYLPESIDGVLAANWVLLCVANVVVGSEQDAEAAGESARSVPSKSQRAPVRILGWSAMAYPKQGSQLTLLDDAGWGLEVTVHSRTAS